MISDLNQIIPGAPDFKYIELVRSDEAIKYDTPNIPNEQQCASIEELARNVLQPIRTRFGELRIFSGFRSEKLNNKLIELGYSASPTSFHLNGEAADIYTRVAKVSLFEILEYIYKDLEYIELIAEEFPYGWIHVAYRKGANPVEKKVKWRHEGWKKPKYTTIDEIREFVKQVKKLR